MTLFAWTESRAIFELSKVNCYIRHAKSVGKLDVNFPEHEVEVPEENCAEVLETLENEVYDGIAPAIQRRINDPEEYPHCVINYLKNKHWTDDAMLQIIYLTSKTLTEEEKKKKYFAIADILNFAKEEASEVCGGVEAAWGKIFDSLITKQGSPDKPLNYQIDDYCIRRYVVENEIIGAGYNVVLNPFEVDVSTANCDDITESAFKELLDVWISEVENTDEKVANCILKNPNNRKIADHVLKVAVLAELDMTPVQKMFERKSFVTSWNEYLRIAEDCAEKFSVRSRF